MNQDWFWSKLWISATLTAATKVIVINRKTNTTSTKIVYADLPEGVTLPPTNAAGTQAVFTTFGSLTTTLAYPTPYLSWGLGYSWGGTLPTVDQNGQSVCSTVAGNTTVTRKSLAYTKIPTGTETRTAASASITTVTLESYSAYTTSSYITAIPTYTVVPYGDTFQRTVPPADDGDPFGFLYTLIYEDVMVWPKSIETDGAFLSCDRLTIPAPAVPLSTALLLTETSTSFEDGQDGDHGPTSHDQPPQTSFPAETTDSPPPLSKTASAPDETSRASPAPVPESQAATDILPTQTIGTVTNPATNDVGNNDRSSEAPTHQHPSTFQTTNLPTTINGSPTSAPAIVIGTQTQAIAPTLISTHIGDTTTFIHAVIIGSQTVAADQTATIGSIPIAISAPAPGASDSAIQIVPAAEPVSAATTAATAQGQPSTTLANGVTVVVNSASKVVVGGQTLQPGANTLVAQGSSSVVAVVLTTNAAGASVIVADGSTAALPTQLQPAASTVILPGGQTATLNSASAVVVGGQTLSAGTNTLGSGTAVAVLTTDSAGESIIVAGGSTAAVPQQQEQQTAASSATILPGGETASLDSASQVVVDGQTLTAGANTLSAARGTGTATADVVVLTTDGAGQSVVVAGGSTVVLSASGGATTAATAVATLADGEVVAVDGDGEGYVVGGQTLTLGTNTLGSGGDVVVLTTDGEGRTVVVEEGGSRMVALTGSGAATPGIGGLILSGLGGSSASSASRTRSASATGQTETSYSPTESANAAVATGLGGSGGGSWLVMVEGAMLAMCMLLGVLPL